MHAVQTSMAMPMSRVRRMRSARIPKGNDPTSPMMIMAAGSQPMAASETWKECCIPSTACDSDCRSPDSRAMVPARATKGSQL